MKTILRSALLLLLIVPAFAQDRTEQKLSDAMVRAMREAVRRENDLTAYCARKGMVIIQAPGEFTCGVKAPPPLPNAAATTANPQAAATTTAPNPTAVSPQAAPAAPVPAVPNPANEQPKANPATPEANKAK